MNELSALGVGEAGIVDHLDLAENVQHHLVDFGFVPEGRVTVLRRAPAGDPTVYGVDGMEIALRRETARHIFVRPVEAQAVPAGFKELVEDLGESR